MNEPTIVVGPDRDSVDGARGRAIEDLTYLLDESEDPDLLVRHAGHSHPWVRQAVAGNPATPRETVAALAGDVAPMVRRNVAIACAELGVLYLLARDPDPATARSARANLRRLARRSGLQRGDRS